MSLYTAPVYDNMFRLYNKEKIESLVAEGKIEVIPLSMCRGRNFSDVLLICDESQNCTDRALEMLLTRICNGSRVILCGDAAQIDLRNKKDSGFDFLCKHTKDIPGFKVITLKANHRHPIVEEVLKVYADMRN
jgi:phosphate starvation-inducible PhoH-like protein